jgi:hypothetical protein
VGSPGGRGGHGAFTLGTESGQRECGPSVQKIGKRYTVRGGG